MRFLDELQIFSPGGTADSRFPKHEKAIALSSRNNQLVRDAIALLVDEQHMGIVGRLEGGFIPTNPADVETLKTYFSNALKIFLNLVDRADELKFLEIPALESAFIKIILDIRTQIHWNAENAEVLGETMEWSSTKLQQIINGEQALTPDEVKKLALALDLHAYKLMDFRSRMPLGLNFAHAIQRLYAAEYLVRGDSVQMVYGPQLGIEKVSQDPTELSGDVITPDSSVQLLDPRLRASRLF